MSTAKIVGVIIHEEGSGAIGLVSLEDSFKHQRVWFPGPVVRRGKHVVSEDWNEVRGHFLKVFTNEHPVVGQQREVAVFLGKGSGFSDFGAKNHGLFSHFDPLLPRDGRAKGFVHPSDVFISGVGVSGFCLPLAFVMPPSAAQFVEVHSGYLRE